MNAETARAANVCSEGERERKARQGNAVNGEVQKAHVAARARWPAAVSRVVRCQAPPEELVQCMRRAHKRHSSYH